MIIIGLSVVRLRSVGHHIISYHDDDDDDDGGGEFEFFHFAGGITLWSELRVMAWRVTAVEKALAPRTSTHPIRKRAAIRRLSIEEREEERES